MTDDLFVYGSLKRGFALHHHLQRLRSRFIAEGKVQGELFDQGRYPGARPVYEGAKWVQGELYQLRESERDLKILDEIEECVPGDPQRSEFVRDLVEAALPDGTRCRAWIYWLGPNTPAGSRIESGEYVRRP